MLRTTQSSEKKRGTVTSVEFEELKSLDLRRCASVGDIVAGMRGCAFGARMLGEAAATIHQMFLAKKRPIVIYDGAQRTPLALLLRRFVKNQWCARMVLPSDYARSRTRGENAVVVGPFSERYAQAIYRKPARAVFINAFDMARPGQIRDGYFPDAVFADPRYVMPVIHRALE